MGKDDGRSPERSADAPGVIMEKKPNPQQALEAIHEANAVLADLNARADEAMQASLSAYVQNQENIIAKASAVVTGDKNALILATRNAMMAKDAKVEKELREYLTANKPTWIE